MESESLDLDTILSERRAAASASMKPVSHQDLNKLKGELFPSVDHPWYSVFEDFVNEHQNSLAVRGDVSDGVEFVYFPKERKGMWFRRTGAVTGMGPLMERGTTALYEVAKENGLV